MTPTRIRTLIGLAALLIAITACQSSAPADTPQPTAVAAQPTQPIPTATVAPTRTTAPSAPPPPPTATVQPASATPAPTDPPPTPQPQLTEDSSAAFDPAAFRLEVAPVVMGLRSPLFATHAGDGSGDIYVVEKRGTIRVVENGALREAPFLDIISNVGSGGSEQGLLGMAFHPDYTTNRFLFVNYTDLNGDTVVARYTANAEGSAADAGSAKRVLFIVQPYANHNGGMLAFGPDGMLWIGTGDGGSGGDPQGNGQDPRTLLGKMLRIDVDSGDPYGIPPDNPFTDGAAALPEIWGVGLRNPWRYSFDRATGDLYVGDVGQGSWEEISLTRAGAPGGVNYGWNIMEGNHCFRGGADCNRTDLVVPIAEYSTHQAGTCAVTGGYVYRGQAYPAMRGGYFYADYCGGQIWAFAAQPDGPTRGTLMLETGLRISSFGEDEAGELYITAFDGTLYHLTAQGD
jgi:glucose/arabinose dehydrogenase